MRRRLIALVLSISLVLIAARFLTRFGQETPVAEVLQTAIPAPSMGADVAGGSLPATPIPAATATSAPTEPPAAAEAPTRVPGGDADLAEHTSQRPLPTPTVAPVVETRVPVSATAVAGSPTPLPPPPTRGPDVPPPTGATINGLSIESVIVMPDATVQHVREIYAAGQAMGRNPRAFSKLGDSTIMGPPLLAIFDSRPYTLGVYSYVQPAVDLYAGSFARQGVATRVALHSWSVLDPMWADKSVCQSGETMLACEFRLHNPSVLLIRLGSNDSLVAKYFDQNMRQVVSATIASGVIPVIGTKPDRFDGPDNMANNVMRKIAADFNIPLWDYDLVAGTLPGRGLGPDNVHMLIEHHVDFTRPEAFRSGQAMHDLTALMMLDAVRRAVGL